MKRFKLHLRKMKVHVSGENECGHCGKEAKTGVNLKVHKMKVHVSSGNECGHCGKVAATKVKLKVHKMNVHESSGNYCRRCGILLTTKIKLKLHKIKGHKSLPTWSLSCGLCEVEIHRPANQREHKGCWHGLEVTKCDPCGLEMILIVRSNPSTAWGRRRGSRANESLSL